MKKNLVLDIPYLLQRLTLIIFALFPIALSIISQTYLIIQSWSFMKLFQFGFLVALFLTPIFAIFSRNSTWTLIKQSKYLIIFWVVGLAIILRIILVQIISTDFVSDMEDVHLLAMDIYSGNPLANIDNYPNIPGATHLNMSALVLSFIYKSFGASTAIAKLFLIILNGLTTFLIYLLGREIANIKLGFLAAFLFATLPSIICYTGVLSGDHLAIPVMTLAILCYARTHKLDNNKFFSLILNYAIIGILVGFAQWFRPLGMLLVSALFISIVIYRVQRDKFFKVLITLVVLLFTYSVTSNLPVKISENIFRIKILSPSQRIGDWLLKGLNPTSNGIVTIEDDRIVRETYARFGNDISGAQEYLIKFAFERLEREQIMGLFKEKTNLIWSSHNALFDYSLAGSNDQELVNTMRAFETLLYLAITIFMFFHTIVSISRRPHPAVYVMQLFILGLALLLLFMEVQNRYVIIVIPYSILLGALGIKGMFSMKLESKSS